MAGKSVSEAARQLVYERDGWRCAACGHAWDLTIQHRVSKGMGGSKRLDDPSNLLTLCQRCNVRLEADAEFARAGRAAGWKLYRNRSVDPALEPCWFPLERRWFLLHPDGTRSEWVDEPAF